MVNLKKVFKSVEDEVQATLVQRGRTQYRQMLTELDSAKKNVSRLEREIENLKSELETLSSSEA